MCLLTICIYVLCIYLPIYLSIRNVYSSPLPIFELGRLFLLLLNNLHS